MDWLAEHSACTALVFHQCDVLGIKIEATELLFIDMVDTASQTSRVLEAQGSKVGRNLAFHDIETCEWHGEVAKSPGHAIAVVN